MTDMNKARKINRIWYFVPALIVLFCVLVVYAFDGVFPFGTESIVHDDMGQCGVPVLYAVWDALHGNGGLLLDLRTAGGVFISGVYESVLTPVNALLFLLIPRSAILPFTSVFLLVKLMLASTTAMLLFTRRFSLSAGWYVLLSVLYAFNPYVLQYYSNITWLEIVWAAPLVFLGADSLLRGKGSILYTLSLAYCLIVQLYISYMFLLFLFLNGAMYIFLLLPKDSRKTAAFRFGASTILAILLSGFSVLPCYFGMTGSSRYQTTRNYFQVLVNTNENASAKIVMAIVMTALPFAVCVLTALHFKKAKREMLYFACSLALFLVPVVFENVNLLWHMGSYVNFPMRYAFLFHLMLLTAAAFGLDRFRDKLFVGNRLSHILTIVASLGIFVCAALLMFRQCEESKTQFITKSALPIAFAVLVVSTILCAVLLQFGSRRVSCALLAGFVLFECGFYFHHGISSGAKRSFEYSLNYIYECNDIYKTLPLQRDGLTRIKNIDGTLNSNYPLLIDYPSMSNFTHTIPSSIKKSMQKLGYSTVYTRILDTGGTLFTDALLGYRYALSLESLADEDYRYVGSAGSYGIYESRYAKPFGTICSGRITDEKFFGSSSFQTMNRLWHTVTDVEKDLFENPQTTTTKENRSATYEFDVEGTKEVYLVCSGSAKRKNMRIIVNGRVIPIPSLGEEQNDLYTTRFNNNVLDLGSYTDMHLTIRVILTKNTITMDKLQTQIATMDKALLSAYVDSARRRDVSVTADGLRLTAAATANDDNQYLFLPITYDSAWTCTVNGVSVKPICALSTFMAIPLQRGENSIQLRFLPKGFAVGIGVSVLGIAAFVLWILFEKKLLAFIADKKAAKVIWCGYFIADCGALASLYLIPMIFRIIAIFVK